MKKFLILASIVLLIVLAGCTDPIPPTSPIPTPPVSPLEPPAQNRAEGGRIEQQPEEVASMDILDVLAAIAIGGAAVGGIISFLFERFDWFQALGKKPKFWTIGAMSIGLPVVATALILYVPASVWVTLNPLWRAAFAGGTTWLGSQLAHKLLNSKTT